MLFEYRYKVFPHTLKKKEKGKKKPKIDLSLLLVLVSGRVDPYLFTN